MKNELNAQRIIFTLTLLVITLSVYMAHTMESSATMSACAGCLKMAAGLSN